MIASAGIATAACEGLAAAVGGERAGVQAGIVIVRRQPGPREAPFLARLEKWRVCGWVAG